MREYCNGLPGDRGAVDALTILDDIDYQERSSTVSPDTPFEISEVCDAVQARHHPCGLDIVLEQTIPQPWKERFLQASIGSTRIVDGPYATDWDKFLTRWEAEM